MPIFVNSNHWVALVRRIINNQVVFIYADDLNNINIEAEIKYLIQQKTDNEFYPTNALWMTCKGYTYFPHSNECGARMLLALHMMALHPKPYQEMLLPIMHSNLAQISRTWIAAMLISRFEIDIALTDYLQNHKAMDNRSSNHAVSYPHDLINWQESHTIPNTTTCYPSQTLFTQMAEHNTMQNQNPLSTTQKSQSDIDTITSEGNDANRSIIHSIEKPKAKTGNRSILEWIPLAETNNHSNSNSSNHNPTESAIFGNPLTPINNANTLRVIAQNTQYALQLTQNRIEVTQVIENLQIAEASIFVAISPNVNWANPSHWSKFKSPFKTSYKQGYMHAASSDIGASPSHRNIELLIGGNAILSFDLWASKVSETRTDPRGHGSYIVNTYLGKNGRKLSIISAYISVVKGNTFGENTLHAQQIMIMEQDAMKNGKIWYTNQCPRRAAIKALSQLKGELQNLNHSIILAIDANQTPPECYKNDTIMNATIEWLRTEHGLEDPFIKLHQSRPSSTTIHKGRDIDYLLTYNVPFTKIGLLEVDTPASSDHYAMYIDIDIATLFQSTNSNMEERRPRQLTFNNVRAKRNYEKHMVAQAEEQQLLASVKQLLQKAGAGLDAFHDNDDMELQSLDQALLSCILTSGESLCSKRQIKRNPWSPLVRRKGRTYSYWQKKYRMLKNRNIHWTRLEKKLKGTYISIADHKDININNTLNNLRKARRQWKNCKKHADEARQTFLKDRAEELAIQMKTTDEKALRAI
jgi:hypothetical protein